MTDTTKDNLFKHVMQICEAVLGSTKNCISISVYMAGEDMPSHISATHSYMIVLDFSQHPELLKSALPRFMTFLGKKVTPQKGPSPLYFYWGEGDSLETTSLAVSHEKKQAAVEQPPAQSSLKSIEWMKSDTSLPLWLETLIFDKLAARHEPNWQRFGYNLDLTEDEIKVYLGTYFPRSYAEAFCILDALFECSEYNDAWKNKTEATILDVGTGTGGNIIGLLTALVKHCPDLQRVTVHGFDGSAPALSTAEEILKTFASKAPFSLDIAFTENLITTLGDLPSPQANSYDFITTFKTGCEIISRGVGATDNFYYRVLQSYSDLLSDIGLMALLDVTTKPDHADYYPQLLNEQVSRFTRERAEFSTLVPVPCHIYETRCTESCFTQKEFAVIHRMANRDQSRVAYRVLARASFVKQLHAATEPAAEYVISSRRSKDTFGICYHSSARGEPMDGYRLGATLRCR